MPEPAQQRMTSDAFIAWAMKQPETKHYELFDGEILAMAPERGAHALTKAHVWRRLAEAIEARDLACQAYSDGMAVTVDEHGVTSRMPWFAAGRHSHPTQSS